MTKSLRLGLSTAELFALLRRYSMRQPASLATPSLLVAMAVPVSQSGLAEHIKILQITSHKIAKLLTRAWWYIGPFLVRCTLEMQSVTQCLIAYRPAFHFVRL